MKRFGLYLCAVMAVLCAGTGAQSAVRYTITELGRDYQFAYALNSCGQIAGKAGGAPVVWDASGVTILSSDDAGTYQVVDINDSGLVVGRSPAFSGIACWDKDGVHELPGPQGSAAVTAVAVSNSGSVLANVSYSDPANGSWTTRFGIWEDGAWNVAPGFGDSVRTDASCMNASGQVAGVAHGSTDRAFVWSADGGYTDLQQPNGELTSVCGINSSGQIVGYENYHVYFESPDAAIIPWIWQDEALSILAQPAGSHYCRAGGINDRGQIIGQADNDALIWENGVPVSLNSLIDPASGYILNRAILINNQGQIVCYGGKDHQYVEVLLTPVPEPSSIIALLTGLAGLGGVAVRRRW